MRLFARHKIGRLVAVFLLLPSVYMVSAQELEYKMELGAMTGGCFYMGDANSCTPFKDLGLAGGILARYNFNPRMVLKGDFAVARIKGSSVGLDNVFPNGVESTFSRNVYELGAQFEYNFFAYGTAGYKDSRRLTPYIQGGLGLTYGPKPANHVFALNLPLGFGVKYKLANRVNCGAEWTMRFTTSDKFDELDDPYGIESKGIKNKDSYSLLMVYVSYDMFPKYRKCNN